MLYFYLMQIERVPYRTKIVRIRTHNTSIYCLSLHIGYIHIAEKTIG